jgi:hypothetical protein
MPGRMESNEKPAADQWKPFMNGTLSPQVAPNLPPPLHSNTANSDKAEEEHISRMGLMLPAPGLVAYLST